MGQWKDTEKGKMRSYRWTSRPEKARDGVKTRGKRKNSGGEKGKQQMEGEERQLKGSATAPQSEHRRE